MKIKLVNDLNTQSKGERATGFVNRKKVVGNASTKSVTSKFNLKEPKLAHGSFVMVGGVPHKMKDGNLVPLKSMG